MHLAGPLAPRLSYLLPLPFVPFAFLWSLRMVSLAPVSDPPFYPSCVAVVVTASIVVLQLHTMQINADNVVEMTFVAVQ